MSPSRRVAIALRRSGEIKAKASDDVLAMLRATRRDVLRVIADAVGYRRFHLSQVLAGIDAQIRTYRSQVQGPVGRAIMDAARVGQDMAAAAGTPNLYGVSFDLVQSVVDVTNDQMRAIWSELGTGLKTIARRATLGVQDPFEAIQKLQRVFAREDQWRSTEYHAERIIRTEVGRAFQMSSHAELDRARDAGLEPKKWWLSVDDSRTRPEHSRAHERYAPGGRTGPIPAEEHFEVGRVKLLYPGDPSGIGDEKELARMTINCRCSEVPYVEEGIAEGELREIADILMEAA
jgi:hypothetical protein